jgi:iron complex transport system permease protein
MSITAAVTNIMITFGQIWRVQAALMWLTGSVYGRTWEDVHAVLPWLLVLLPPALLMTRELNTLALGDEVASSLGSDVTRSRLFLLITSAALAGISVTLAGTLSFVGLMAPHIGCRLVGPAHEGLQPVTALIGGAMVVLADLVGRTVLAPAEIPCGIIVSIVGAPFFLWLLYQHRKR